MFSGKKTKYQYFKDLKYAILVSNMKLLILLLAKIGNVSF